MVRPVFLLYYVRTGITALNVVSAALDADPRTAATEVRFVRKREDLARALLDVHARGDLPVVGWSFFSTDFPAAAADLAWVRARTAGAGIGAGTLHVAGGVHASAEPFATLRAGFDLVAVGEGEATVVELFHALATGGDPRALPGTAHLDADGRLVARGPGVRRPLDDFPAFNVRHGKWNAIEITRGCIYACAFCQTPFLNTARFRHRSVANVRAQVAAMVKDGVRYVRFLTPTALSYGSEDASVDLAQVEALLAGVRAVLGPAGKIYFGTFPSELRPEHVTPAALAVLKRFVDHRTLDIGGQSGSEEVLAAMHRGHGVAEVERAARVALEAGFRPDIDILFGLPGETGADRAASLALAERLVARGARVRCHAFLPLPGTPLGARLPAAIEPEVALALARIESTGAAYGQWRRQVARAAALVARRGVAPTS